MVPPKIEWKGRQTKRQKDRRERKRDSNTGGRERETVREREKMNERKTRYHAES